MAPGEVSGTYSFPTANMLYNVLVQYKQTTGNAFISLQWSASGLSKQLVPPTALFSGASNIALSPFLVQT